MIIHYKIKENIDKHTQDYLEYLCLTHNKILQRNTVIILLIDHDV
jgi:hypothetical protein